MQNVITLKEIAAEFGVQERHAARKARLLAEHHGFPRPLPGMVNKFSRALVEAWFARGGQEAPAIEPEAADARDPVAQARKLLEARYVQN
ncbi:hypothetical protein BA190_26755 [Labrys sp. WJW]|uniref:hypothetical protein n=1 Tax=Labrys sp. WJW TaxID=1737983 RepID=UPI00082953B1|nr:hypothetical protein [Labrys sp. WJW]OCC01815.1 hypothetical protein BA190_26755 [Labrys sp. WJW]